MNIFLIPYTWMRHLSVAFVCAGAGLLAWWLVLTLLTLWSPWQVGWDGAIYLTTLAAATGGASVLAECTLRRDAVFTRIWRATLAGAVSGFTTLLAYMAWTSLFGPLIFTAEVGEATLVTLRYRLPVWIFTGIQAAAGPLILRKFKGFVTHAGGGLVAGLAGGCAWYALGIPTSRVLGGGDLYLASAGGALVFGGTFGLLAWGIPDSLYAGWLRVVSESRHGRRIPVDVPDGGARERFVGHFPRGLDLFLPADDGVLEMHVSVMVDRQQRYRARGLTLQPTLVRRFLERIDLRYDSRRPAPLETRLSSGDRLVLGPPDSPTVLEFLMLPREER